MVSNQRTEAIDWWNNMGLEEKFYKVIPWLSDQGRNVTERHPDSLTSEEIEDIYNQRNRL